MRNTLTRLSVLFVLSFVVSLSVQAQSDTAINNVKAGLWSDPTVWSTNAIPGATDSVVLRYDVQVDVNAFCKYLRTDGHNVLVMAGKNLNIAGHKPEIKDNVHYIDSTRLTLTSTRSELQAGIYKYAFNGVAPVIKANDVIYGITGNGYIRRVNAANVSGNTLQLNTTRGNMTDVFGNANLDFGIAPGDMSEVARTTTGSTPYSLGVSSKTLLSAGPVTVTMDTASISFSPNFKFNFAFSRASGLESFSMGCNQAALNGEMKFTVAAQGAITATREDTLKKMTKTSVVWIGEVPVVVVMDLYLMSKVNFTAEASIQKSLTLNANALIDLGVSYANGAWQGNSSYTPAATYTLTETNGKVKAKVDVSLKPQFNVRFYDLAGPFVYLDFNNSLEASYSVPSLYWDAMFKSTLEAGVGAELSFYKDSTGAPMQYGPIKWNKDLFTYRTPFSLKKISGDQQSFVDTSNYLPIPIKVQVLDTLGKPQKNVAVVFKVNKGGGHVQDSVMVSDTSGYAQTFWKYGSKGPVQELQAHIYKGDSTEIGEDPTFFRSGKDSLKLTVYNTGNTPAFTTNSFKTLGVGKGGFIWAGTQNQGLYTMDTVSWMKQATILTNHNINQIQSDRDGSIWLAFTGSTTSVGGGLGCIRDSVVTATSYTYYGAVTNDAPNRNARSIFVDTALSTRANGLPNVWSAHMGNTQPAGDPSGSAAKGLLSAAPYFSRVTTGVQTISQGGTGSCQIVGGDSSEVWVFANSNFGRSQLLRYNTKTTNPIGWYDYTNVPTTVLRKAFFAKAIYFDAKGRNWVGLDTGIAVKDKDKWVRVWEPFIQFLPANTFVNTHAIDGDSDGNIYIGTNNGFFIYIGGPYNDKSSWVSYTTADSLPSNNVLSVKVDEKRARVIIGTDAGVAIWKR